jgi:hypothetical protein
MHQLLSMFLQFVETWKSGPAPKPDPKFAQVGGIPAELFQAVEVSMQEWQEISVAEHLGESAFKSAEWIGFNQLFLYLLSR